MFLFRDFSKLISLKNKGLADVPLTSLKKPQPSTIVKIRQNVQMFDEIKSRILFNLFSKNLKIQLKFIF